MPWPYDDPEVQQKPQPPWGVFVVLGVAAAVAGLLILIIVLAIAEFF